MRPGARVEPGRCAPGSFSRRSRPPRGPAPRSARRCGDTGPGSSGGRKAAASHRLAHRPAQVRRHRGEQVVERAARIGADEYFRRHAGLHLELAQAAGRDRDVRDVVRRVVLRIDQAIAGDVVHHALHERRGALLVRGEPDIGCGPFEHMVDVLGADARFDDQRVVPGHDLHQHVARAYQRSGGEPLLAHHPAVDRRQPLLALGGIARRPQARLDIENARRGVLQLVDGALPVGVLCRDDAQLELGSFLPRARKLGAVLAVTRLVFRNRALQRQHADLLYVVLLQEVFVRLELLLLQRDGAVVGGELGADGLDSGAAFVDLRAQRGDLALDRFAARAEQRTLALEDFRHPRLALAAEHVGREWHLLPIGRFGGEPRRPGALGDELDAQKIERGVDSYVLDHDQGLALLHAVAVARADLTHDAAFLVLHHLAVEIDLDEGRGNDRAGQRRERGPAAQRDDAGQENEQTRADQALELAHAARLTTRCRTSERAPKASTAPSRSTSTLSTLSTRAPRSPLPPPATPPPLRPLTLAASACSPSASRLALGSSSTTRRGSP